LNLEQFGSDIKQGVIEKRIKEDRQSGIRSGVNGTPTFFINGKRYDGSPDYNSLLGALESALGGRHLSHAGAVNE